MSHDYKRLSDKLLEYWQQILGKQNLPREEQIDLEEINEILNDCFLLHVQHDAKFIYKYDFLGENLIQAYGKGMNQDVIELLISTKSHPLVKKFDEVLKSTQPVYDSGEFLNSNRMTVKYRQILLPLANKQGEAEYILGGIRWKDEIGNKD